MVVSTSSSARKTSANNAHGQLQSHRPTDRHTAPIPRIPVLKPAITRDDWSGAPAALAPATIPENPLAMRNPLWDHLLQSYSMPRTSTLKCRVCPASG